MAVCSGDGGGGEGDGGGRRIIMVGSDIYIPNTFFFSHLRQRPKLLSFAFPLAPLYFSHPQSSLSTFAFFFRFFFFPFSLSSEFIAILLKISILLGGADNNLSAHQTNEVFLFFYVICLGKWIYYRICSTGWRFSFRWESLGQGFFFSVVVWV